MDEISLNFIQKHETRKLETSTRMQTHTHTPLGPLLIVLADDIAEQLIS